MAYQGKHNVLELIRTQKTPYWRLYENNNKRSSGNYIDTADFSDASLDVEISRENLRRSLDSLTTGTYVLTAYSTRDKTKGGIDTLIEIEGRSASAPAISGIGAAPEFYMEGIGKVTPENFESVIEAKFKTMQKKLQDEQELLNLKAKVVALEKQVEENESGFNKGVMSIGAVVYDYVKSTPSGKEFIGLAAKAMFGAKQLAASSDSIPGVGSIDTPSGLGGGSDEDRVTNALERLSQNNPEFITQLEKLAKLKETDPGTFEVAVGSLESL